MDDQTNFSPLIASVVSIQPEEFEELEQLEPTAGLTCQRCSFKCTDSATLDAHEAEFHLCKVCGWSFKERENLLRHRRSHARAVQAGAAMRNCKFCGQEFVNNKILMRHIITNHESQQMDYLATSLHSKKKEDNPMECHERPTTEDLPLSARKPTSAPKLLVPGFFHPTLKKGPFVAETHAKKRLAFQQKNCVIKNLAKLKETNYFVLDKSVDGGNVVKIITSEGKKHNSIRNGIEEDNEEGGEGGLDITESLDRMLDQFEKEEREEQRSRQMMKETTPGGEALAVSKEEKAEDKNGESSGKQDAVSDKEEKTGDKKLPAKERSPSEGEFLNISFHDEILAEEQGSSGQKRRLAIVKDSRVIGRVTTSSQFRPPESHSSPYFHTSASQRSLSDQYEQFWTKIGLVPKIKQKTVHRKVAKRKSEQQKRHLMVRSGEPKIKNPWSPIKSICMKKFPSEGFSSPDTSNHPSSVRALTKQTKHSTSLKCDICSEGFLCKEILIQHVKEKHQKLSKSNKSVSKNEVPPNKSCDVRKFKEGKWQINTERGVTKMKSMESKIYKEEKTESLTNQQIQLQKKVKDGLGNPAGKLKCASCEFRTNFNWYLKKHTLSKHKDIKDYEFFCLKCDFKTNFKWNLKKHWNNKHSGCNSDLKKGKDDDKEDRIPKVKKSKSMEEAESIETKASRSKNGYNSPKQDKDEKSGTKKMKDVRRVKGKSAGGFIDKKLSEVPELNPYSRQLSCSRKEGRGGGERDLAEERKRNLVESVTEPYCRLCQLLLEPELRFGLMRKGEGVAAKLPKHSVVWVPNRKEGNGVNEENEQEEDEEESVISRLLVCSSCQLCVHRSCYLLPEEGNDDGWTCQACGLPPSATCSLCQQPGGLLQRTGRGRLIHLDCALLLPETTITGEGSLSLSQVPEKRRCLECVICGGQESEPGVHCQASSQCRVAFHPGCALRSGVDVVVGPLGRLILRCGFCVEKLGLREHQVSKFDQQDIFAGERVELTSGQTATVLEVVPETYYSVAFDDGTFCDNHDPEEVKYEQGTELGINTEVRVMWEGRWCTGLFKGSNTLLWYRVGSSRLLPNWVHFLYSVATNSSIINQYATTTF